MTPKWLIVNQNDTILSKTRSSEAKILTPRPRPSPRVAPRDPDFLPQLSVPHFPSFGKWKKSLVIGTTALINKFSFGFAVQSIRTFQLHSRRCASISDRHPKRTKELLAFKCPLTQPTTTRSFCLERCGWNKTLNLHCMYLSLLCVCESAEVYSFRPVSARL